jgi:hypothetical protein
VARSHIDGASKAERERTRLVRVVAVLATALACLLIAGFAASRYVKTEQPGASLSCAAKLYSPYDPGNLEQCMAVCMTCSGGVKTTCSTSCTLKGAR